MTIYWLVHLTVATFFSLRVLSQRAKLPSLTLAWIMTFFLVPVLGVLLYLLIGYHNLKQRKRLRHTLTKHALTAERPKQAVATLPADLQKTAVLCEKLVNFPVVSGNTVQVYEEAFASYKALTDAMKAARHHIHLEYYIFQSDDSGDAVRNILIEKAKQGVECRLLLDHLGSYHLNDAYLNPLREAGVHIGFFWPLKIARPWGMQLRNHRKIAVMDGAVGFVGSQNIGNEYSNWKNRNLSWRDAQVRITGPGVLQLQRIFIEDWSFTTGEQLISPLYLPDSPETGVSKIQSVPTGPDEHDGALEEILMSLIHSADRRITMQTPYFIPTPSIVLALDAAATRGIRVDLMSPRRSDNRIVDFIAKGWYRDLLKSGIHLYEYHHAFLHAKVVTIDDRVALLGSANMDERSFRLNFECSVLLYDKEVVDTLTASFDAMMNDSRKVASEEVEHQSFWKDVRDGLFRILSPLF